VCKDSYKHKPITNKHMKKSLRIIPPIVTTLTLAAALAGTTAYANEFSGSLAFGSLGVTTDNPTLQSATTFSLTSPYADDATGIYATLGVTNQTPVAFSGFKFNPPVGAITPLWTFDIGPTVFSFDAISETATFVPGNGAGEWVIIGTGVASITGFDNTPATWTLNLSDSGNMSLAFDATSAELPPSVPDGGKAVTLLGGALTMLGLYGRRSSRV
jgi:hypothetical protein